MSSPANTSCKCTFSLKKKTPAIATKNTDNPDHITFVMPIDVYVNDLLKHPQTTAYKAIAKIKYAKFPFKWNSFTQEIANVSAMTMMNINNNNLYPIIIYDNHVIFYKIK